MSYTSVKKILQEQDEKERAEYEELIPMFERMEKLAAILRKKRMKRGSIDFDFPETKIILDKKIRSRHTMHLPVKKESMQESKRKITKQSYLLITQDTIPLQRMAKKWS